MGRRADVITSNMSAPGVQDAAPVACDKAPVVEDSIAVVMAPCADTIHTALLAPHPEFKIAQTKKGCFQECCGCDANSQFKFMIAGQHVGMLDETSGCCVRLCCGSNRWWNTRLVMGQDKDSEKVNNLLPAVLEFSRPFRCRAASMKCCCYQEVIATDSNKKLLGGIKEQFWCCVPKFTVYGADLNPVYDLHQPTCCGGQCVDCCAEGCCNCRIPFYLYPSGGGDDSALIATNAALGHGVDPKNGPPKAQICKIWAGLGKELFTDADTFEVKCPDDATPDDKAILLAATLLINQISFEKKTSSCCTITELIVDIVD